ncbi:hypothetical protein BT96DRAFT_920249 [Gymnopus androsaceus JB14]|uniref:Uncharacterized protein n=1 Tax=Gymnopus androsaceus JB14 TaxID=1447944 RepID=A0A6A4HMK5_9AGAR|nr:hypothetical protein BT96DRAFT_920249 [Gymnopus androsaceus JB14]
MSMRNPFLIVRFILLSILFFLNLLELIFASWNASAAINANLSLPGSSIFLIFCSVASLFFLALGLIELYAPNFAGSSVAFESGWAAALSISQLGATIGSTITTAAFIRDSSDLSVTASSLLLVPTTWLTSLTNLGYFFVLFVTTMTHVPFEAGIWTKPVHQVKWFGYTNSRLTSSEISRPRGLEADSWTRYLENIETSGVKQARNPISDPEKAPWAPTNVRRGRDHPFRAPAKRSQSEDTLSSGFDSDTSSESSFSSGSPRSSSLLPPLPLNIPVKGQTAGAGSRFIERFRESHTLSRPVMDFPHEVDDHDKPIPKPRLSQWISADTLKALTSRNERAL